MRAFWFRPNSVYTKPCPASQKLGATTFPFVAFVALQNPRGVASTSRSTTPVMTILSRHQGAPSTTARVLREHITTSLLPRVMPTLERLRTQQRERELGLRCSDPSCGIGPSDEEPFPPSPTLKEIVVRLSGASEGVCAN